jgi:putative ABC transport system permease protein
MYSLKLLSQFFRDMRTQKLRTLLTLFGIIWGTVAVVLLLAFGVGLHRFSLKAMHGMGERIVILWPQRTTKPYQGMGIGRPIRFTEEDAWVLDREIPEMEVASPEYIQWGVKLKYGKHISNISISGVYPAYEDLRNTFPQKGGRFINSSDIERRRRVIFLGDEVKEKLFKKEEAVGKRITLNGMPFMVVGVLEKKTQNSSYSTHDARKGFIPATTLATMFGHRNLSNILYRPKKTIASEKINKKVYQVLGKKHRFDPEDKDALSMWDTTEMDKFLFYFSLGLNLLLGVGGVFTLIVGGIGVANIMYVVVRERTREIGIKMAIGAKSRHILFQFILETLFIVTMGGVIGFGFSWGIVKIASSLPIQKYIGTPTISPIVAGATIFVLGLVGLLAGYFPARKAANLDPVQSLGY